MLRRIVRFTLCVEDLDRSVRAYAGTLGYGLHDSGRVSGESAALWRAPALVGARWALLGTPDRRAAELCFVEQPATPGYDAATVLGWSAVEIAVRDPYALARRLEGTRFRVVVAPRPLPFDSALHAMQVLGPDGELLYFTQLPDDREIFDLTGARHEVDRAFIAVLGCADLERSLHWYGEALGTPARDLGDTVIQIINERYGLSAEARTRLGIVKLPRDFLIEIDALPPKATARPRVAGWLPPGIAVVSFEDDAVAARRLDVGPSGEWIERLPAPRL
jgi:catechol 2,3-dioxygenase-like lactoylglutathione lyase family enzyme